MISQQASNIPVFNNLHNLYNAIEHNIEDDNDREQAREVLDTIKVFFFESYSYNDSRHDLTETFHELVSLIYDNVEDEDGRNHMIGWAEKLFTCSLYREIITDVVIDNLEDLYYRSHKYDNGGNEYDRK